MNTVSIIEKQFDLIEEMLHNCIDMANKEGIPVSVSFDSWIDNYGSGMGRSSDEWIKQNGGDE